MSILINNQTESITAGTGNLSLFGNAGSLGLPKGSTASRPGSPIAGMFRFNTDTGFVEYYSGSAWANPGNSLTSEQTLASSSTTDLGTASSNIIKITGNTTISSFGSTATTSNPIYFVRFTGSLILTYNATSMILPNGANNITTTPGDTLIAEYLGSGNWKVIFYQLVTGPVTNYFSGGTSTGSAGAQVVSTVIPNNFTLTQGVMVSFIAGYTSTGFTSLNIAGSGVITMQKRTPGGLGNIIAGDMIIGAEFTVIYDGTYWQLLDPIPPTITTFGKQTVFIPATALAPRTGATQAGCANLATIAGASNQPDIDYLAFATGVDQYAKFSVDFSKSWNAGTVTARFIYQRASATSAANIVWGIRGLAVNDGELPATNFGSAATVTGTVSTTSGALDITAETGACTLNSPSSPAASDICFFEIFRNGSSGSDTLGVSANLIGILLFYTTIAATDA